MSKLENQRSISRAVVTASQVPYEGAVGEWGPNCFEVIPEPCLLPFKMIIFPVDFSDRCRAMAPVVRQVAEKFNADLVLLHVVEMMPFVAASFEGLIAMPMPDPVDLRRWQGEHLKEFSLELFPGMKPTLLVEDGDPGCVVRDIVRHDGADLVMLPTHGRGAFRRLLLGSVANKILHDVDCAIWTDVHHAEAQPAFPCRRVLCALDLASDEAAAVLRAACSIARAYEADLAIERHANLIVTGRGHSKNGFGRAESQLYLTIRKAPCPVLSI